MRSWPSSARASCSPSSTAIATSASTAITNRRCAARKSAARTGSPRSAGRSGCASSGGRKNAGGTARGIRRPTRSCVTRTSDSVRHAPWYRDRIPVPWDAGMSFSRTTRAALARLIVASSLVAAPGIAGAETVLITGANSGLGLEFTKQYAAKGWTVIATHRRREVPATLAEVVAKYPKVRVETLDVTDLEQAKALAAKLKDVPIDILVNNAGVYNDRNPCASGDDACPGSYQTQSFGQMDFALLDTIMDVNIKGPLIVSQTFYPKVERSTIEKMVQSTS